MGWRGLIRVWVQLASLCSLVVALPALSQTSSVDWKYYGQSTADGVTDECFFDLMGAVQGKDDHIKVWSKCLHKKDVEAVDIKKEFGGKIVEDVADKLVRGYIPPIVAVEDATSDQFVDVTTIEEIADVANIQPSARIFYELDCRGAMLRELSIEVVTGGRTLSKHSASEWKYIAPETNGLRLKKMLCGK
jgi:hypothetical protein